MKQRSKELDFLRGIAILLVMLRHSGISTFTTQIGWIGVDLFFVLSGFLVSGLLFAEYKKQGKVWPFHFLIRRGFKIYPLFYTVVVLHILYFLWKDIPFDQSMVFPEVFFYQNYKPGIMGISWSLAIEEHFYFLLAIALFVAATKRKMESPALIPFTCLSIAIACLALRLVAWNTVQPFNAYTHFFPTHLRVDSLAFGVLLSWLYHFSREWFFRFVRKFKILLISILPILFLPVLLNQPESGWVVTLGFSFLFLAFGFILSLVVVFAENIRHTLQKWKLLPLYYGIAWVGVYSYSIYLLHMKAGPILANLFIKNIYPASSLLIYALLFFAFNILSGYVLSLLVEQPFLRLREKYFPRKVNEAVNFERQPSPRP